MPERDIANAQPLAVAVGVTSVYREPDAASEVVTQALLGTPATALREAEGWLRVRLPDYEGWIPVERLTRRPADAADAAHVAHVAHVAVVTALQTPLYAAATGTATGTATDTKAHDRDTAYITTVLPLRAGAPTSGRVPVVLPGDVLGWLDAAAVAIRPARQPFPPGTANDAVALAQRLLDVPYLWGGTSPRGLDCSGLAQLCWRHAGVTLRRDANQQYESIPYAVGRGDLQTGDLAFFARDGAIIHVGIMLDDICMLHADGTVRHRVTINALAPGHDDYSPRLDALYAGARRPLPPRDKTP